MQHEAVRVLADGDLVAIHGRFQGLDENPLVGFDIYRVKTAKLWNTGMVWWQKPRQM